MTTTVSSTSRERARQLLEERAGQLPCWVRPPKIGSEYFSGLGRSKLYALSKEGKIRSVSIREPGQNKGTRLFELQSILNFIEKNAANAEGTK